MYAQLGFFFLYNYVLLYPLKDFIAQFKKSNSDEKNDGIEARIANKIKEIFGIRNRVTATLVNTLFLMPMLVWQWKFIGYLLQGKEYPNYFKINTLLGFIAVLLFTMVIIYYSRPKDPFRFHILYIVLFLFVHRYLGTAISPTLGYTWLWPLILAILYFEKKKCLKYGLMIVKTLWDKIDMLKVLKKKTSI